MTGEAIRVEGLKPLIANLKRLDTDLVRELKTINKSAAEIVAADARARAPHRTGRLARSVRAGATQRSGVVRVGGATVPYAGPIHFGWARHNIAPQPFMFSALDAKHEQVLHAYEKQVSALIERVF